MTRKNGNVHILFSLVCMIFILFLYKNSSFAEEVINPKITLTAIIENVTNPVNNVFTYKIESDAENGNDVLDMPKTFEVKFENVVLNAENKAIVKYDLDFRQFNYEKERLYSFTISEIDSSNKETFPVSGDKYNVNINVIEKNIKLVNVAQQALNLTVNEKSNMDFKHGSSYTHIYIKNGIRGELASENEYFKYKLEIQGNVGDKYLITGQDEKVQFNDLIFYTDNIYTVKAGEDNYLYIYLKANQEVWIGLLENDVNQIPIGVKYRITSVDSRKWKTFINRDETKEMDFSTAGENPEENQIFVVHEKEFDVALTGIFINILPFMFLIIISIVVIILMRRFKEVDEEEDEEKQDNK